jgi:hypothetical protein
MPPREVVEQFNNCFINTQNIEVNATLYHGTAMPNTTRIEDVFAEPRFFSFDDRYAADYCYNKNTPIWDNRQLIRVEPPVS